MKHLNAHLKAPFPWFGGKSRIAAEVWTRFGRVVNYVEPFFGSGAVLLARPTPFDGTETVNDLDGYVANAWRSIKLSPEETAEWADNPVNENDLHARHVWLVQRRDMMATSLEGDPDWHDPKIAGWWLWGMACWIGCGFCSGNGPWWVDEKRQLIHMGNNSGGVNRKRVQLSSSGMGVNSKHGGLVEWFSALAERFRSVRVCSGDWSRVCSPSVTYIHGMTGVFLDPPYADTAGRCDDLYRVDSLSVAHDVREWAIENGKRKDMRIALCGYEGEHAMPDDWSVFDWKAQGGYGTQADEENRTNNEYRERMWFSPACLSANQYNLFSKM
jgi:hypothetical protein